MRDLKPILVSLIVGGQNKKLLAGLGGGGESRGRWLACWILSSWGERRNLASPHLGFGILGPKCWVCIHFANFGLGRRDKLAASPSLIRPSLPALAMCKLALGRCQGDLLIREHEKRFAVANLWSGSSFPLSRLSNSRVWPIYILDREPTVITLHICSINIHCRYPNIYVWSTSDSALTTVANIHKNCLLATCHNLYLVGIILLRSCIVGFIKVSLSLYLEISAAVLRSKSQQVR